MLLKGSQYNNKKKTEVDEKVFFFLKEQSTNNQNKQESKGDLSKTTEDRAKCMIAYQPVTNTHQV